MGKPLPVDVRNAYRRNDLLLYYVSISGSNVPAMCLEEEMSTAAGVKTGAPGLPHNLIFIGNLSREMFLRC